MADEYRPKLQSGDGGNQTGRDNYGKQETHNYYGVDPRSIQGKTKSDAPIDLSLIFDRTPVHKRLIDFVATQYGKDQRCFVIVLPASAQENPSAFVERYEKFGLREVCHRAKENLPYKPAHFRHTAWPQRGKTAEVRFDDFLKEAVWDSFLEQIGKVPSAAEVASAIPGHLPKDKHQIVSYQVRPDCAGKNERELLSRCIRFWAGVKVQRPAPTLTAFFSLHSGGSLIPGTRDWSRSCAEVLAAEFQDQDNVLVLNPLPTPRKTDVAEWVGGNCDQAWKLIRSDDSDELPLNKSVLETQAEKAFGWLRRHKPMKDLEARLHAAIAAAYEIHLNPDKLNHGILQRLLQRRG